jgi:Tol biopolymer transport system component
MTHMTDLDLLLDSWLDEVPGAAMPDAVVDRALAAARVRRQRPDRLPFLRRDFPMQSSLRFARTPSPALLLLILVIAVTAVLGVVVAARLLQKPVPPPFGLATSGEIVYDANGDIVVADARGANPKTILGGPFTDVGPVFSPDGSHVAFWRTDAWADSLVIAGADGASPVTTQLPAGTHFTPPVPELAWSPDSKHLAGAITGPAGPSGIWTADADGHNLRQIGDPTLAADSPEWSPTGDRIAFRGGDGSTRGLYVMAADGSGARKISTVSGDRDSFAAARWQPGGDLIAFYAGSPFYDIYLVRSDGTGEVDLTKDPQHDETTPAWSPDGKELAFLRDHAGLNATPDERPVIMAPDGSGPREFDPRAAVAPDRVVDPAWLEWSPDATRLNVLAYTLDVSGRTDQGTYWLMTMSAVDGGSTSILETPGNVGMPSWQRLP